MTCMIPAIPFVVASPNFPRSSVADVLSGPTDRSGSSGHESHQLLWPHQGFAVRVLCLPVLHDGGWAEFGPVTLGRGPVLGVFF